KSAGRGPDAHACSGSQQGSPGMSQDDGFPVGPSLDMTGPSGRLPAASRRPAAGPFCPTLEHYMADVRDAALPQDLEIVRQLWLHYLTWGNDELEARHRFRLPVTEAVEHDVAAIGKFQPPDGRLLLA